MLAVQITSYIIFCFILILNKSYKKNDFKKLQKYSFKAKILEQLAVRIFIHKIKFKSYFCDILLYRTHK